MAFNRAYLEKVHKECLDLGERKSNDYSSVADGIAICGLPGISTRLVDKVLRIKSLTTPGINQQVKDESIRDTLLDIINYASYGVAILDKRWGLPSLKSLEIKCTSNDITKYALNILSETIKIRKPKWKPKSKKKK